MAPPVFFYGTLCHAPLLAAVLGRDPGALVPARLADHAVHWAEGQSYPVIHPRAGAEAAGLLLTAPTAEDRDRLDFYERGFGYVPRAVTVGTASGGVEACVYFPRDPLPPGAVWNLGDWAAAWGGIVTEAAREVMAIRGSRPAEAVFARYPQILVRAASRLRARPGGPTALRRHAVPEDVVVADWRQPYAAYFAVEEMRLRFRRFDGTFSDEVERAVFQSGDAATVLPYDPARDRVLLIEQFRVGPFARGDGQPWLIEPIAGRIDAGETPEEAIRREAVEEAGLTLGELIPIASYYPTPAGKAEYLYSFLGLVDLPDGWQPTANGVADEHEDIQSHVVPFDRLMELVASGEVENGPLLISALFLAARRPALRAAA